MTKLDRLEMWPFTQGNVLINVAGRSWTRCESLEVSA